MSDTIPKAEVARVLAAWVRNGELMAIADAEGVEYWRGTVVAASGISIALALDAEFKSALAALEKEAGRG